VGGPATGDNAAMSFDLGVWYPDRPLSNEEAGKRYARLCDDDTSEVVEHPAVQAFYDELVAKHPEIDDIPEDRIDDSDYCPWSVAMDRSPGHVIMCCVWSKADYVGALVADLAAKHGLVLYDPQSNAAVFPAGSKSATPAARKPWWKIW
jgi:hypothetical protein